MKENPLRILQSEIILSVLFVLLFENLANLLHFQLIVVVLFHPIVIVPPLLVRAAAVFVRKFTVLAEGRKRIFFVIFFY